MEDWVQVLKQRYAGMKLLVGRDKLDEIQVGAGLFSSTELARQTTSF